MRIKDDHQWICRFSGEYHIHHVFCQDHHHNLRLRISWLSMKWWLPPFPCFWNEFLWQHFKLSLLSQLFKTSPRLVLSASLIRWTRKDVDVAWFQSFFKEALHERSHHLHKCLNFGHPNLGDVLKTWSHFKKSPRQRAVRKKILLRWDLDLPIFHTKGVPPSFLVFVRQKWSRYLYDPTFPLLCLFGLRRDFVFGLLSKDISWVGIMEINFLTT